MQTDPQSARATVPLMDARKRTSNVRVDPEQQCARNRTANACAQTDQQCALPDNQWVEATGLPMCARSRTTNAKSNPLDHARAELDRPDMHPAGPPMCTRELQCAHATGPPIRTHNKTTNARATRTAIHAQPDCQCACPTDHHCVQTPGLAMRAQPNRHCACGNIWPKCAPNVTANAAHIGPPVRARSQTTNKRVQPTTNARTCGDRQCARATGPQMPAQNRTVNVPHNQPPMCAQPDRTRVHENRPQMRGCDRKTKA